MKTTTAFSALDRIGKALSYIDYRGLTEAEEIVINELVEVGVLMRVENDEVTPERKGPGLPYYILAPGHDC
jgi:hypothetical protein